MNVQLYIEKRIDEQIVWFSKESVINKRAYFFFKVILTASAAIIPSLTSYVDTDGIKVLIGLFSIITAFLANINSIFSFKDKWLVYRSAAEFLRSEKHLFEATVGKYNDVNTKDTVLVETVESFFHKINAQSKDMVNMENDNN
jgi:hypothetical protein